MRLRIKSLSALAAIALLSSTAFTQAKVEVGQQAPDFTLTDQNGKAVKLSDYAGKTVVLEWFNDGCPYVVKHYKNGAMNATAAKYAEKGVVWLAVNSTNSATVSHNAEVDKKWKLSRPILDDHAGTVGKLYGATNTPQMFVVDASGKVIYSGAIDSVSSSDSEDVAKATNYVAAALDENLAGKAVAKAETKPYGCTVKYSKK